MSVDAASLVVDGPWQHRYVSANGSRFHVAIAGPDDRDAPLVVLLHGVPQFWWAWRHQLPAIAAAGYRVAAMDLRGACASDKPPQGYDVPTATRDVAGVVRSLGAERAVVVGHGLGGGEIAWAMPAYHPHLVTAVAALSAPHPLQSFSNPLHTLHPRAMALLASFQVPLLAEHRMTGTDQIARILADWSASRWPSPDEAATYLRAAQVPFAAHCSIERARWLSRAWPRPDGRRFVRALESTTPVPALQIHGSLDGCRPASAAAMRDGLARQWAGSYRFELLRGAGHFLPEEQPEAVNTLLLDWLGTVTPAA